MTSVVRLSVFSGHLSPAVYVLAVVMYSTELKGFGVVGHVIRYGEPAVLLLIEFDISGTVFGGDGVAGCWANP